MLKLDLKKEIGELGALVIAFIIGFVASSFWIGLISFVVLELVYLLVYDAIAKKAEAQKPKEEKEEINFHEYDDDTECRTSTPPCTHPGRSLPLSTTRAVIPAF